MNNKTLKIAIHRLAAKLTLVNTIYYTLGVNSNSEQIVFYIINDSPDGKDTGNNYSTIKVQFNVFSKALDNGNTCDDMLNELMGVVTKDNLVLDDGSEVIHIREDFIIPSQLIQTVWQSTVQYSIHINKV